MKKTYPTSTKSQQWAKHLRPYGKRLANKSTRKIIKETVEKTDDDFSVRPVATKRKSRQKFVIEFHSGNQKWKTWKKYITEGRRDKSLESLIKRHKNSNFGFMNAYEFRALNLKNG
jgi:hypothetical protein